MHLHPSVNVRVIDCQLLSIQRLKAFSNRVCFMLILTRKCRFVSRNSFPDILFKVVWAICGCVGDLLRNWKSSGLWFKQTYLLLNYLEMLVIASMFKHDNSAFLFSGVKNGNYRNSPKNFQSFNHRVVSFFLGTDQYL